MGLCKNEGSCIADCDTADGYTCSCPAGWEGRNCHLKVDNFLIRHGSFIKHFIFCPTTVTNQFVSRDSLDSKLFIRPLLVVTN